MTPDEFSNGFDVLVNSYRRFKDFDRQEILDSIEFNEYEKSYYLTAAQEELILSLYNGRNSSGNSFEETEELRRFLSNLISEASLSPVTTSNGLPLGVDSTSKFFTLPSDLWFITYESVHVTSDKCGNASSIEVVPVTQDEYHRVKKNPFRGANSRRALRLDLSDNNIEIVCKYPVDKYYVRYLKQLRPIVVDDMPDGVTIKGVGITTPCALHENLHQKILELAVTMALRGKGISIESDRNNRRE